MLRRTRTTKTLAERIDLQYFQRPHPFRRWRLWLSILVPVVAGAWLLAHNLHSEKVYSSGPLSSAHAAFGKNCRTCHVRQGSGFSKAVTDIACLACHDGPPHHPDKAAFTPSCGSCHIEHKGAVKLASTKDSGCIQCHAKLGAHLRNATAKYVSDISGFDHHHPEFAVFRAGTADPGRIKLNHSAHLKQKIAGPEGPQHQVQMDCEDCHRPVGMEGTWPYAAAPGSAPGEIPKAENLPARAYMTPIRYKDQCAGCHEKDLEFDKRFPNQVVPHDRNDLVQATLYRKYTEYFDTHPGALTEPVAPERMLAGTFTTPALKPRNREEWIKLQVEVSDRILWGKGCKLCHLIVPREGQLPEVAPSNMRTQWLEHAVFDHDAHRLVACDACHVNSRTSQETAQILIPGIALCRNCHQEAGPTQDAASAQCSECHVYHDWSQEKPVKSRYTIEQLRSERQENRQPLMGLR